MKKQKTSVQIAVEDDNPSITIKERQKSLRDFTKAKVQKGKGRVWA